MKIIIYRSRRLFGRPEWRWKAVAANGRKVANGGEGYYNLGDLQTALSNLLPAFANAPRIVEE